MAGFLYSFSGNCVSSAGSFMAASAVLWGHGGLMRAILLLFSPVPRKGLFTVTLKTAALARVIPQVLSPSIQK